MSDDEKHLVTRVHELDSGIAMYKLLAGQIVTIKGEEPDEPTIVLKVTEKGRFVVTVTFLSEEHR